MCWSTSATRGSTGASGTADGTASRSPFDGRGAPVIKSALLVELARFSRRNTLSAVGGLVGLSIIVIALAAPLLAPRDPLKADFRRMTKPPDAQNFFGTDQVGRDTLSRVIYGARTSLFVAFSAVLLGTTVGSVWGLACGYLRGRFDLVSQRIMEILQSFPDLILAMRSEEHTSELQS